MNYYSNKFQNCLNLGLVPVMLSGCETGDCLDDFLLGWVKGEAKALAMLQEHDKGSGAVTVQVATRDFETGYWGRAPLEYVEAFISGKVEESRVF